MCIRDSIKMKDNDSDVRTPWEKIVGFADSLESDNTEFPNSIEQSSSEHTKKPTHSHKSHSKKDNLNDTIESIIEINTVVPSWTDVFQNKTQNKTHKTTYQPRQSQNTS